MKVFISIVCLFFGNNLFGQKSPIDFDILNQWQSVKCPLISDNGKFVMYTIENLPVSNRTLIIQSIVDSWNIQIAQCSSFNAKFTKDNKFAIFIKGNDTLGIVTLGTDSCKFIPSVSSFQISNDSSRNFLAYKLKNSFDEFVICDSVIRRTQVYSHVKNYLVSTNGKFILLYKESIDNISLCTLEIIGLSDGIAKTIWSKPMMSDQEYQVTSLSFDTSGNQVAFIVGQQKTRQTHFSLWYYKLNMDSAVEYLNDDVRNILPNYRLANDKPRFSTDGFRIFFSLEKKDVKSLTSKVVKVDVWSYNDERLQSLQHINNYTAKLNAVMNLNKNKIVLLTRDNNEDKVDEDLYGRFVLVTNRSGHWSERSWKKLSCYLVSTINGERNLIKKDLMLWSGKLSPEGKFIIYFDNDKRNYFIYNVENGSTVNVTQKIPVPLHDYSFDRPVSSAPYTNNGIISWSSRDSFVFIYDHYDIWKIDPNNVKSPICITNQYGARHKIVFRFSTDNNIVDSEKGLVLLTAFNPVTKYNGFYMARLNEQSNPDSLTFGPFVFHVPVYSSSSISANFPPIKAINSNRYIVKQMSEKKAPNYYWTSDFKSFSIISDIQPQKNCNWITSHLLTWKLLGGKRTQGILYKPENFDSTKKYPLIFYIYERFSDMLHFYLEPKMSDGQLNIPWFVSNGFLVFTPDIYYTIGEPGRSAYNSVVSAAEILAKIPWIDSTKYGIYGHSFGGFEVNYLITHSKIFAAAAAAAAESNFVSGYGSLIREGFSKQYFYEVEQNRIGATLWERPDLFIANSPVFNADKVVTPLLMMNNKRDQTTLFEQGIEFFTALRRLNKKVWMLNYDNGDHELDNEDAKDYTIRLMQFFNHYLKNASQTEWFTPGNSAVKNDTDRGLDLDTLDNGIRFVKDENWQKILSRAGKENKYIFLDCYASWCKPCKEMEKKTFANDKVGEYFETNFISVRVQMDTSKNDDEITKLWYNHAHEILTNYNITVYPTHLFFSPDGKLVHRGMGYKDVEAFLQLAEDALSPSEQYYTLLSQYKQGHRNLIKLSRLAKESKSLGEIALAKKVAAEYIKRIPESKIIARENIQFIKEFTSTSKERGFWIMYKWADTINKIMDNERYASQFLEEIVMKEDIIPILKLAKNKKQAPDWNTISTTIKRKYSLIYLNQIIINAKVRWYAANKQWSEYTKYLIAKLEITNGNNMNGFDLNNDAWSIFERSTKKYEIDRAIYWMNKLFETKKEEAWNAANIDTYANLLYKAGRTNEAILWEEKAIDLEPDEKVFKDTFEKMKGGLPTWPPDL